MDFAAEQQSELELVQTVYPDELTILSETYPSIKLRVDLPCVPKHENPEPDFFVGLTVSLPEKYPDDSPQIQLDGFPETIPTSLVKEITEKLEEQARSMPGYQVLITLITEVQYSVPLLIKQLEKQKEETADKIRQEKEDAEQRKFEVNRVTVESFNRWREQFERDFFAAELEAKKAREAVLASKLTGKQQFLRDSTLNVSDLKFVEMAENEPIEIDEIDQSLFEEELSDLEIEDESEG